MAQIKKNEKQMEALKGINEKLEKIRTLNSLLIEESLVLCSTDTKPKGKTVILDEDSDLKKVRDILNKKKQHLIKQITQSADKYDIELSDEENELLNF